MKLDTVVIYDDLRMCLKKDYHGQMYTKGDNYLCETGLPL